MSLAETCDSTSHHSQTGELSAKQRQVDIDNVQENARQVTHGYAIGDQVYVEITGIHKKLDYNKKEPYRTTEVFKNITV